MSGSWGEWDFLKTIFFAIAVWLAALLFLKRANRSLDDATLKNLARRALAEESDVTVLRQGLLAAVGDDVKLAKLMASIKDKEVEIERLTGRIDELRRKAHDMEANKRTQALLAMAALSTMVEGANKAMAVMNGTAVKV